MHAIPQSALPQGMPTVVAKSGGVGVPVMKTIVDLLTMIMEHTDDLNGSSKNKVLHVWPSNYKQFGSYATKMSDTDRETLQIADLRSLKAR